MQTSTVIHPKEELPEKKPSQSKWQRIILLFVLGYEGAGALSGGSLLIIAPDGRLMDMPVEIMHGTFSDFLIPGIILFAMGILNIAAFFAVLRRTRLDWRLAVAATGGMLIWFWVEIAILLQLHWLHAMWGLPVIFGMIAAIPLIPSTYKRKALLYCGILASALYVAINFIVPPQWKAYHTISQTVSELSAIGAPTRRLWTILATPYTFLMLAFAWGVFVAGRKNFRLRVAGILLIAYSALGFLWPFAPMHLRETLAAGGGTFSDSMHITLGVVTEILYLLALGFTAAAFGRKFRIYSVITFILLLVFGVLTFLDAPGIARNEPTPFIGAWERINIGLFLIWTIVLAIVLLRNKERREKPKETMPASKPTEWNKSQPAQVA